MGCFSFLLVGDVGDKLTGPIRYPADHALATGLKGSDNIVSFTTKRYSPRPLIIQGAGAGADVTAMGVTVSLFLLFMYGSKLI